MPVEIGAQPLGIGGNAAAPFDAAVADAPGVLHSAFSGEGGGQIGQVIVLPGNQRDADFHTHITCLSRRAVS